MAANGAGSGPAAAGWAAAPPPAAARPASASRPMASAARLSPLAPEFIPPRPPFTKIRLGRWTVAEWEAIMRSSVAKPQPAPPAVAPKPLSWAARVRARGPQPTHSPPRPRPPPPVLGSRGVSEPGTASANGAAKATSPKNSTTVHNGNVRSSSGRNEPVVGEAPLASASTVQSASSTASPTMSPAASVSSHRRPRATPSPTTTLAAVYNTRLKSARGVAGGTLPVMPPRGLVNSGNTCFINVVLQALLACSPFRRMLLTMQDIPSPPSLLARFVRLAVEMSAPRQSSSSASPSPPPHSSGSSHSRQNSAYQSPAPPLLPDWFDGVFPGSQMGSEVTAPGISSSLSRSSRKGSQEDAQEFLTYVLNALHEELIAKREFFDDSAGSSDARLSDQTSKDSSSARSLHRDRKSSGRGLASGTTLVDVNGSVKHNGHSLRNGNAFELESNDDTDRDSDGEDSEDDNSSLQRLVANGTKSIVSHRKASGMAVANGRTGEVNPSPPSGSPSDSQDGGVWEEMTRKGKSVEVRNADLETSPITDIFGGVLRSELKRPNVKLSVTREPFLSLSLDIESGLVRDVEGSLTAYFEPERLEGYTLESSSEAVDARKHVQLDRLPEVLVLHLKRFSHNMQTGALTKVNRRMDFPELLEVPAGLLSSSKVAPATKDRMYELTAVVTHIGKELAGGHYTCDVRTQGSPKRPSTWTSCDDSKVGSIPLHAVLRKPAYLLFYSKVTSEECE